MLRHWILKHPWTLDQSCTRLTRLLTRLSNMKGSGKFEGHCWEDQKGFFFFFLKDPGYLGSVGWNWVQLPQEGCRDPVGGDMGRSDCLHPRDQRLLQGFDVGIRVQSEALFEPDWRQYLDPRGPGREELGTGLVVWTSRGTWRTPGCCWPPRSWYTGVFKTQTKQGSRQNFEPFLRNVAFIVPKLWNFQKSVLELTDNPVTSPFLAVNLSFLKSKKKS